MIEKSDSNKATKVRFDHKIDSISFIMLATILLLVLVAGLQSLPPNDFFPYVRIGDEIVRTGSIPTTEFMTYTQYGKPVQYQYWLPSLIFYWMFTVGGVTLTTLMVMLCTAAYIFLLWKCMKELGIDYLLSGLLILVLGLTAGSYYIARPQIFAFPLFGFTLLALLKWQRKDDRIIWYLPLTMLLWVNLHGSFIIQFFLILPALLFGSGNRKKMIIITLLCLMATLLNIYGFGIWKSIFSVVENQSNQIYSMEFQKPTNEGWQANILFGTFLLIPVLTALVKPKVSLLYWAWFMGFGWMALSGIRYGIWYLCLVIILLGLILNPLIEKHVNTGKYFQNQKMNLLISLFLLILPFAGLPGVREYWWKEGPPVYSETTPIKAVEWLRQNPQLPGEVWCDFTSCTYMTYALPERKLFMTNRMDDFPVEQYEDYLHIFHGQYNWQSHLNKYHIKLMLFDYSEQPILIKAILVSPAWKEVYRDDRFVVFFKASDV